MLGATFLLIGVFAGAFLARRIGGGGGVSTTETCAVWCSDGTKKTKTCQSGKTGDCLADLLDECPSEPVG